MAFAFPHPMQQHVIRVPVHHRVRAKVLLVSTDHFQGNLWRAVLLRGHFAVTVAAVDQDIADLADHNAVDVVVLARTEPAYDMPSLCWDLRMAGVSIPILILHPQGSLDDLLDGFEAGTDAYLCYRVDHADLFRRISELSRQHALAEQ